MRIFVLEPPQEGGYMSFFDKLEKKLGRFAIPHLMYYLIALNAFGVILNLMRPELFEQYLSLNAEAILHGQVWRIITFIIQPPSSSSLFWSVLMLYIYYLIGSQLERVMGTFKFNSYIFLGIILHVVAALVAYAITGVSYPIGTSYLYLSFFFIYAMAFPNAQFLLFFLLPIRGKWIAILDAFYFVWAILQAFLPQYGGAGGYYTLYYRAAGIAAFVSMLNALIYYLSLKDDFKMTAARYKRRQQEQLKALAEQIRKRENAQNQAGPYGSQVPTASQAHGYPAPTDPQPVARHRCAVCGRTELDDPNLEFRYCSKCNGNYEYCSDHLFNHEHKK